jgi:prepilin-type N-terminal cleavage/methylation domain-containing protein
MPTRPRTRAGFTLIELAISMAIFSAMMVFMTVHMQREARGLRQLQSLSQQERVISDLMMKIESQLDFAQGEIPTATLASSLPSGEGFVVDVDSSGSFPDQGILLINAGNASEERIRYDDSDPGTGAFLTLERGAQGGTARSHAAGAEVLWAATAAVLAEQTAPVAGSFDGQSRELLADLFYRGDGTGFSYRVPVDPAGGTNYLTPTGVRWGATIGGRPTEDGRACIFFEPVAVLQETERNFDFNSDGDLDDMFDLGRIRQRAWDAVDGDNGSSDLALSPPMIIQERDAWGADLDNDGFEDPMFLWTPLSGRLRIRFFALVGTINQAEVVKRYETVLHLRNGAAQ